jgi:hypothetical protein
MIRRGPNETYEYKFQRTKNLPREKRLNNETRYRNESDLVEFCRTAAAGARSQLRNRPIDFVFNCVGGSSQCGGRTHTQTIISCTRHIDPGITYRI